MITCLHDLLHATSLWFQTLDRYQRLLCSLICQRNCVLWVCGWSMGTTCKATCYIHRLCCNRGGCHGGICSSVCVCEVGAGGVLLQRRIDIPSMAKVAYGIGMVLVVHQLSTN